MNSKRTWISIICALATIYAAAYDFSAKDANNNTIYYNYLGGDSVEVTNLGGSSYTGDIVIPLTASDNASEYRVTRIGEDAFMHCTNLISVTIPNSITSIGTSAYLGCASLTEVVIPSSVTSIGNNAFVGCLKLVSIVVEEGNPTYDSRDSCNAIIETASNTLIQGCSNTIIPNTITAIGNCAFKDNSDLTTITIPESVTSLGQAAFAYCSALKSIDIPNSIVSINKEAFFYCTGLTSVTIGNSVISIGYQSFFGCSSLTSIDIPNGIDTIKNMAFASCSNLVAVSIPASVTSIADNFLSNCKNLSSIIVAKENKVYDSRDSCNAIINTNNMTLIAGCKNSRIPDGILTIGPSAFEGNGYLSFITIPRSVGDIRYRAFYNCTALDTVVCYATIPPYAGEIAFEQIASNAILFVPYESLDAYHADTTYSKAFSEIKGFSEVVDITENSAELKWIPDPEVTLYTIDVNQGTTLVAHYEVDSAGNILSSSRPAIPRMKKDTTTSSADYFTIKINDLEAGEDYNYTIKGTNSSQESIYHEEGAFHTTDPEGIEPLNADDPCRARKVLQNGQMLIIRGEDMYTIQGTKVR